MIKKIVVIPDVHLDTYIHEPYKSVKKFILRNEIDEVVILGDFIDCKSVSHWLENNRREMEGKRFALEMKAANNELTFLQQNSKKVTYLEGNHEFFIERYLDKHPELTGVIDLETSLFLRERRIELVRLNKLYQVGKLYMTHGLYINQYHASKHLKMLGCSVIYGHSHRPQTDSLNMLQQSPHQSYGLGCLCEFEQPYLRNAPPNWLHQFAVVYVNDKTGNFNVYPITIVNNSFMINGVYY